MSLIPLPLREIFCSTEGAFISKTQENPLTECPTDPLHTVVAGSERILNKIAPEYEPNFFIDPVSQLIKQSNVPGYVHLPTATNSVYVSIGGKTSYSSIKDACTSETTPGSMIYVYPGTYVENNPIVLAAGVNLISLGIPFTTSIVAINQDQPIITANHRSKISKFSFVNASLPGGCAVSLNGSLGSMGDINGLQEVQIINCHKGVIVTDGPTRTLLEKTFIANTAPPASGSIGVEIFGTANVSFLTCVVSGFPTKTGITGIKIDSGANDRVVMLNCGISNCETGIDIGGVSEVKANSINFDNCTDGIILASGTVSELICTNAVFNNISNYDIDIVTSDANTELYLQLGLLNTYKINNPNNLNYQAVYINNEIEEMKRYVSIVGELCIGDHFHATGSFIGGGKHYDHDLQLLTNTNLQDAGSFTTIDTSTLSSTSGGLPIFAGTAINNCVYIGSSTKFWGLHTIFGDTVLPVDYSTEDSIIFEYWHDGNSSWTRFNTMGTRGNIKSFPNYGSHTFFELPNTTFDIRFGISQSDDWGTLVLTGSTVTDAMYWVRMRIDNGGSPLSVNPKLSLLCMHSDSLRIEPDGFIQLFGNSRIANMIDMIGTIYDLEGGSIALPIYLSKSMKTRHNSVLMPQSIVSSFYMNHDLPMGIDTGFPILLSIMIGIPGLIATTIFSGTTRWLVEYTVLNTIDGNTSGKFHHTDIISAPITVAGEKDISVTSNSINPTARLLDRVSTLVNIPLDISDLPGIGDDCHKFNIQMKVSRIGNSGNDTLLNSIFIDKIFLKFIQWRESTHISML